MPPRNIPKSFSVEMDPKNKGWFEEYKQWEKTNKHYHSQLKRFLEFPSNTKPFNTLTNDDVEKFRDEMKPHIGRRDSIIYALDNFKQFLVAEKDIKDDFLKDLKKLAKATPPIESNKAEALNLAQISYIRKYNKDQGDINDEYIFEIFFQLGINKDQLEFCHPTYKAENEKCFFHDGKSIPYNEKIAELLEKVQDNKELSLKFSNVDTYLKKVTEYLRQPELELYSRKRQIRKIDLKKSHEAHFIKCPNCHTPFENAEKNWALAKIEGDKEFYIVCTQCMREPQNKGENNEN